MIIKLTHAWIVHAFTLDPAEIAEFSIKHTTVRENKTLTISCYVTGNPAPIWSIRNNYTKDQVVAVDKSARTWLTTGPVRCEHAGLWMCTGYNYLNHGKNATRGENVTVLCTYIYNLSLLACDTYRIRLVMAQTTLWIRAALPEPLLFTQTK